MAVSLKITVSSQALVFDKTKVRQALPRRAHSKANRGMTPGNRNMAPRPYISTAMDQRRTSLEARLVAAINGGLKFQRMK